MKGLYKSGLNSGLVSLMSLAKQKTRQYIKGYHVLYTCLILGLPISNENILSIHYYFFIYIYFLLLFNIIQFLNFFRGTKCIMNVFKHKHIITFLLKEWHDLLN
jgi:hypothetical protein